MGASRRQGAAGPTNEIPNKLYFKIGEVADLVGVQTHVLRYWEKEIPFIRPGKTASNQRRYRRRDVEIFREIRRLLHQERFTLAGARRQLMAGDRHRQAPQTTGAETRRELADSGEVSEQLPTVGEGTAPSADGAELEATQSNPGVARHHADTALVTPENSGPPDAGQLRLSFSSGASNEERLERIKKGLRELIAMSGEEP